MKKIRKSVCLLMMFLLVRCKITEIAGSNIFIRGEKAAHGYDCTMYVSDIVKADSGVAVQ